MNKILKTIFTKTIPFGTSFIFIAFFFISCAKDIVDVNGSIHGVVKDFNTSALIANCQVSLAPGGKSFVTGPDGIFEFDDLEPGTYTVSFSKAGYEEASKTVKITSSETSSVNITLKAKSAFSASDTKLDFGDLSSTLELYFFNNSDEITYFSVSNIPSWASFSPTSGALTAGGNMPLIVSVNRDAVDYGTHTQIVSVDYKGKTSGTLSLTIQMQKVKLSAPTVTINVAAENITQNEFTIQGELTATGGAVVTSYGHCWSLTQNPTVESNKTDNGPTTDIGSFKSVVNELTPGTTYYVRTYATNQYGTAYSQQIAVTTQDVASNKWDGTIAKAFAGGSGTSIDPYIIKTGGQLLLMKDYNDKYFELANDIDLDNRNWLPFEFKGTLDGKGCVISNLKVNRTIEGQGLFSKLGGSYNPRCTVNNLTIKNVNIVANTNSYIGAIAGKVEHGAQIFNCHVILTENSHIIGNENVGGIAGGSAALRDDVSIVDCTVDYLGNEIDVIKGNNYVGGIIGRLAAYSRFNQNNSEYKAENVKSCSVSANIKGASCIGGIIGTLIQINSSLSDIYNCSFKGALTGDNVVGGIIGYSECGCVIASKADVNLTATTGYGGGIIGQLEGEYNDNSSEMIIACYSRGIIKGSSNASSYGGLLGGMKSNHSAVLIMSYSTIESSLTKYDGIAGIGYASWFDGSYERSLYCASTSPIRFAETNQGSCQDITTFLKECYQSEYDTYWNYQKTWTCYGKIGGSQVKVSCPKLSWE